MVANLCHPLLDTIARSVLSGSFGSTQCTLSVVKPSTIWQSEWTHCQIWQSHPLQTSIQMLLKVPQVPKDGLPREGHKLWFESGSHCTNVQ